MIYTNWSDASRDRRAIAIDAVDGKKISASGHHQLYVLPGKHTLDVLLSTANFQGTGIQVSGAVYKIDFEAVAGEIQVVCKAAGNDKLAIVNKGRWEELRKNIELSEELRIKYILHPCDL